RKKNRPNLSGKRKKLKAGSFSTQSDITCNCQKQNASFCEYERKPTLVIKLLHRLFPKTPVKSSTL
ncbi:MAG: hypothetical protein ACYSR6_05155, partial [Planctomycetota bacterium]